MDLIDKIEAAIKDSEALKNPRIKLTFDRKGDVFGSIISDSFSELNDQDAQAIIWDVLRKRLEPEELAKIFMIFNQTPEEAGISDIERNSENQKFWYHISKNSERIKYWMFIDVMKTDKGYQSFYFILNASLNFKKRLIYNYPEEVLNFMEFENEGEIETELLNEVYKSGEAEIMGSLLEKFDEYTKKEFRGSKNPYSYIYESFSMTSCKPNELIFNKKEVEILEVDISKIKFPIVDEIIKGISVSKKISVEAD